MNNVGSKAVLTDMMIKKLMFYVGGALLISALSSCVGPTHVYRDSAPIDTYQGANTYKDSYSVLPVGYQTVWVSGAPYYFYGNSWYRRSNSRFIRSSRPIGYKGSIGRSFSNSSKYRSRSYGSRYTKSKALAQSSYRSNNNRRINNNVKKVTGRSASVSQRGSQIRKAPVQNTRQNFRQSSSARSQSRIRSTSNSFQRGNSFRSR